MGIYVLLFIGTTPIGSYLIGYLAEHLSSNQQTAVRATVLCMAGLCAAGVVTALIYGRRKRCGAIGPVDAGSPGVE